MSTPDPPTPPGAPPEGAPPPGARRKPPKNKSVKAPKSLRRRTGRPPWRNGVMRQRGAPSKFSDEIARAIVESVGKGCTLRAAAGEHALNETTVHVWVRKNLPYKGVDGRDLSFGAEVRRGQAGSEAKLTRKWFELCEAAQAKDWRAVQGLLQVINRDRFGPPAREDQSAPVLLSASPSVGEDRAGPVIRFFLPALIDEPRAGLPPSPPPAPHVEEDAPASGPRDASPARPAAPPPPAPEAPAPAAALPFNVVAAPPPAEPAPAPIAASTPPPEPPPPPPAAAPPAIPPWMRKKPT